MSFTPVADHSFNKLTDITPDFLHENGIVMLMMDLDNTVSPYGIYEPDESVMQWVSAMKSAGIELFIVSNSKSDRPDVFASAMDVPFIKRAWKPFTRGVRAAMAAKGRKPSECALVGDQSYTDVLAANCCGVQSILVEPIDLTNPLLAIRYAAEKPFRRNARSIYTKRGK